MIEPGDPSLLESVDLRGTDLTGADLTGARSDDRTRWPAGYTPPV